MQKEEPRLYIRPWALSWLNRVLASMKECFRATYNLAKTNSVLMHQSKRKKKNKTKTCSPNKFVFSPLNLKLGVLLWDKRWNCVSAYHTFVILPKTIINQPPNQNFFSALISMTIKNCLVKENRKPRLNAHVHLLPRPFSAVQQIHTAI